MDNTDKAIIELNAQGKSLREIAGEVGISHVAVKKRLDRLTESQDPVNIESPRVDDEGRLDISQFPDIVGAMYELDKILNALSERLAQLGVEGDMSIHLENGWKIEREAG